MGSNIADHGEPICSMITKDGRQLRTGYAIMISRLCQGTAEEQHTELQMARGRFKVDPCRHEHSKHGCRAGHLMPIHA